ncbi:hypothetical protein SAY86_011122 [Trapa natans]|uniref:HTH myb-type domain-containing protein n=1 Tax=Trapa natans TaxID=22666 RepID=A0AAN7LMR2_TRANT|nr:hypothetical protein SAY86_011122 [Trapa natans]
MRESNDKSWFSEWEEELPSPDELMPLSKTLITPDLARVFDISPLQREVSDHLQEPVQSPFPVSAAEFADSGEENARALKRPRLVWTPQLHKRFVDAVAQLGIKNAVPKTIMQLMNVDGLTRENVASHLQKYRLYLKRMQHGLSSGGGEGGFISVAAVDSAAENLFTGSSVPPYLLQPNSDHFLPFVRVPANHHQQQMAATCHLPVGHFRSVPNGQLEHPLLSGQIQRQLHPMEPHLQVRGMESLEMPSSNASNGGRKILTLFPNEDD